MKASFLSFSHYLTDLTKLFLLMNWWGTIALSVASYAGKILARQSMWQSMGNVWHVGRIILDKLFCRAWLRAKIKKSKTTKCWYMYVLSFTIHLYLLTSFTFLWLLDLVNPREALKTQKNNISASTGPKKLKHEMN